MATAVAEVYFLAVVTMLNNVMINVLTQDGNNIKLSISNNDNNDNNMTNKKVKTNTVTVRPTCVWSLQQRSGISVRSV